MESTLMIIDILKALLYAGLPIALVSYFLVIIARKETQTNTKNAKQLKQELQQTEFTEQGFWKAFLYKKWMKFGGGFYGVVTFLTYLHIELFEVIDFIQSFFGTDSILSKIGLMLFVEFFVDSIINFVYAFLWPFYWSKYLPIGSFWVWLGVAILAHIIATQIAMHKSLGLDNEK
jgi:hypothetical protein